VSFKKRSRGSEKTKNYCPKTTALKNLPLKNLTKWKCKLQNLKTIKNELLNSKRNADFLKTLSKVKILTALACWSKLPKPKLLSMAEISKVKENCKKRLVSLSMNLRHKIPNSKRNFEQWDKNKKESKLIMKLERATPVIAN